LPAKPLGFVGGREIEQERKRNKRTEDREEEDDEKGKIA
jgi:hypothetical protein